MEGYTFSHEYKAKNGEMYSVYNKSDPTILPPNEVGWIYIEDNPYKPLEEVKVTERVAVLPNGNIKSFGRTINSGQKLRCYRYEHENEIQIITTT